MFVVELCDLLDEGVQGVQGQGFESPEGVYDWAKRAQGELDKLGWSGSGSVS